MMKMPVYPLLEVMSIKKRRVEDQEKVVKEKKVKLEQETKKLKERERSPENHSSARGAYRPAMRVNATSG